MSAARGEEVRRRERAFYDRQAAGARPTDPPRAADPYDLALLAAIEPIEGARVLELGCGRGDLTLELLRRGAEVVAVDLSPAMVALARERAERLLPGGSVRFVVGAVEDTGLDRESFDRVLGKWILHHADVRRTAEETSRLLRPEGWAAFFENHDRNPLLRLARPAVWLLPRATTVGTRDEQPLRRADVDELLEVFGEVDLSYPGFYLFEALSRALGHRLNPQLKALDHLVWRRLPRARPYGYHVLIRLRRR